MRIDRAIVIGMVIALAPSLGRAAEPDERFTAHVTGTAIVQAVPAFRADRTGPQSFPSRASTPTSVAFAAYLGASPWVGAEAFVIVEYEGRNELRPPHGVAAYPNAERFRTGDPASLVDTAPVFLLQTLDLGGPLVPVAGERDRLRATRRRDRVELTVGRFGLGETFDRVTFAHDAGTQFLNAALVNGGAFDFASDALGYTWGLAGSVTNGELTGRAAAALMPKSPGSLAFDTHLDRAHAFVAEGEARVPFGAVRLAGYANQGAMGTYDRATTRIRAVAREGTTKTGLAASAEQDLTRDLGSFERWSIGDGRRESFSALEIDQSFALGGQWLGRRWRRDGDAIGLAFVTDLLAPAHRRYLERGGAGKTLGDGGLRYRPELVTEAYYRLGFLRYGAVTADYQLIVNPGYDAARGPMHVLGLRVHGEI